MAGTLRRADPSGELVRNMTPRGTGGNANARLYTPVTVVIPVAASATGAALAWINPEAGTVLVTGFGYWYDTAGTGTVDIGVASDGTAAGSSFIDGGTMVATLKYRPDAASSTVGSSGAGAYALVGPGGTGTNNSITFTHNEAATGTAVGGYVFTYTLITNT